MLPKSPLVKRANSSKTPPRVHVETAPQWLMDSVLLVTARKLKIANDADKDSSSIPITNASAVIKAVSNATKRDVNHVKLVSSANRIPSPI